MRARQEHEIPCGDEHDLEIVGSRTRAGFAQPVHSAVATCVAISRAEPRLPSSSADAKFRYLATCRERESNPHGLATGGF